MAEIKWYSADVTGDVWAADYEGHHFEAAGNETNDFLRVVRDRKFFGDLWSVYPITDYVEEGFQVEDLEAAGSYVKNWQKWEQRKLSTETFEERCRRENPADYVEIPF